MTADGDLVHTELGLPILSCQPERINRQEVLHLNVLQRYVNFLI